jgi:hypothetical protein
MQASTEVRGGVGGGMKKKWVGLESKREVKENVEKMRGYV